MVRQELRSLNHFVKDKALCYIKDNVFGDLDTGCTVSL